MEEALSSILRSDFDELSEPEEENEDFTYHGDGPNFIDNADQAYIILLNVFRFLSVKDLLSAARVCKVWNLVAHERIFWKRVHLKNCTLSDINKMGQTLKKYGTEMVDLRGMSIPFFKFVFEDYDAALDDGFFDDGVFDDDDVFYWSDLCRTLINITTLSEINIAGCPASAVTLIAKGAPQLKSLSASCLGGDYLDFTPFRTMKNLRALTLVNDGATTIFDDWIFEKTNLEEFKLTTLIINRVTNLSVIEHILPTTLVSLALGEYHSLSPCFHEVTLPKLVNLTTLRLEDCCRSGPTAKILEKISTLSNLSELELINFQISKDFNKAIAKCIHLKSLLIIPLYKGNLKEQMVANLLILNGVRILKNSLHKFVWGVTSKHIEETKKLRDRGIFGLSTIPHVIGQGDSISILSRTKLGILSLAFVMSRLSNLCPNLKSKILKVPLCVTWKLSLHNIRM